MSAFIISKETIDYIVTATLLLGRRSTLRCDLGLKIEDAQTFGALLLRENIRSVTALYGQSYVGPSADLTPASYVYAVPQTFDWTIALKQVRCYIHQACEHDGWESSQAKAACDRITACLLLFVSDKATAYRDAPWGLDDVPSVDSLPAEDEEPPLPFACEVCGDKPVQLVIHSKWNDARPGCANCGHVPGDAIPGQDEGTVF